MDKLFKIFYHVLQHVRSLHSAISSRAIYSCFVSLIAALNLYLTVIYGLAGGLHRSRSVKIKVSLLAYEVEAALSWKTKESVVVRKRGEKRSPECRLILSQRGKFIAELKRRLKMSRKNRDRDFVVSASAVTGGGDPWSSISHYRGSSVKVIKLARRVR
jgi:flagellar biogenesis protein FliO